MRERAYPLALAFFVALHVVQVPLAPVDGGVH